MSDHNDIRSNKQKKSVKGHKKSDKQKMTKNENNQFDIKY